MPIYRHLDIYFNYLASFIWIFFKCYFWKTKTRIFFLISLYQKTEKISLKFRRFFFSSCMNAENHWTWPEYSSQICMYLRDKAIIDHWLSREIQWSKQWQAFLISTSIFSHKRTKISSFSVMFFFFFWFHFLKAYNC